MRRGAYGYDAPYALVTFGCLSVVAAVIAAMAWRQGPSRPAIVTTIYFIEC